MSIFLPSPCIDGSVSTFLADDRKLVALSFTRLILPDLERPDERTLLEDETRRGFNDSKSQDTFK